MQRDFHRTAVVLVTAWALAGAAHVAWATPGSGICSGCHGSSPQMSITPANNATLNFGNVLVGESASKDITVQNPVTKSGLIGQFPSATGEFAPAGTAAFTTEYQGQLIRGRTATRTYS
jgi:hypothetical protein